MAAPIVIEAVKLRAAVRHIVLAGGSNEREAALVADNLVLANLTGHDSHGIGMLPQYILAVVEKRLTVNAAPTVTGDHGAILNLDGNMGYGQVIGHDAMELGIRRARELGVCIVSLRNSHHIGRIGHWGEQCAAAGFVSTHYVNVVGRPPLVAPHGGSDARFATNPYCCALPATEPGGEPLVLDMATSKIAMGKVRVAMNKGEQVAPDTLIDAQGNPTTEPRTMFSQPMGAILAFGGHKGYGLAVIAELLAGAFTGGGTIHDGNWTRNTITNNMLSVIVDPAKLGGAANWRDEMAAFVKWVKASKPAPGTDEVLVAGEPERRAKAKRLAEGVPVDPTTWGEIVAAGESVGISASQTNAAAGIAT
ncbi:MAG TPA: malate/lactate/ureidoglycolate dehydrogenase [Ferrovibrio sp.]|uniref:malate/lactate/ureidoglycolate dehydrogenase n=1 Tax=Ferrovibrio sp. TaxID=1917215 RepID=UPI002B4B673F|nr:malate/lactate/ureidoglycolate dehydrogenase [Ferrovibrio sp.]HLT78238.1 malate/lactate/ureidoglycolate dehydrogenase [Ferrovibrio sp.]